MVSSQIGSVQHIGRSIREDVRQHLRDAIIQGELRPGEKIVESQLARQLGISQAPVREALRELEQTGLVVNLSRRGTFVRQIKADDAWEMYNLRAYLECRAGRLAIARLTDRDLDRMDQMIREMVEAGQSKDRDLLTQIDAGFHEFLCERSGNGLLLRSWRSISPLCWTLITVATLPYRDLVEFAERHRPMLDALRSRDVSATEVAIRDHLLTIGEEVVSHLRKAEASGPESIIRDRVLRKSDVRLRNDRNPDGA